MRANAEAKTQQLDAAEKPKLILHRIDADVAPGIIGAAKTRHLGNALRDPLTGRIYMKGKDCRANWVLTDLWTRNSFEGSIHDIVNDPYILKARALTVRTWIWHSIHHHLGPADSKIESGLFEALEMRVCDHAITDTSPLLRLLPGLILTTLSMDVVLMFIGLGLLLGVYICDIACNSYKWYWTARHFSLPIRIGYVIVTFALWSQPKPYSVGVVQALGYLAAVSMVFYDIARGDFAQLVYRREANCFEVVRALKNEVFVVMWKGVPKHNPPYLLPEMICGCPIPTQRTDWRHIMLVAVIQGILCELRPFEKDDSTWFEERLQEHLEATGQMDLPLNFNGCDVFSPNYLDVHQGPIVPSFQLRSEFDVDDYD